MIYDIILNMEKTGIKPRIKLSQYDKTLPQIRATVYSNNQSFNIPSDATVYISGTKKDNTGFKYECSYSDNVITADITDQMTAFAGDVEVEFTIESAGSRKGTENFILEVEPAALKDDVVISETDIPAIQRLSQPASTTQLGVIKVDGTSVTVDEDGTLHSSGGGGTSNYNNLTNKPQIAGITLSGNKSLSDLGIAAASDIPDELSDLNDDSTHRLVTDTEKSTWNGKSVVSVTQIKTSGEKIAEIEVDGVKTDLFASAGGGGGGAVDSVNGMTGDVVLTASDVGALADNTPIPSDLSDLSDVDTSGVTDGQILKYNATSGKFLPSNESGGGTTDYTDLTNKPSINGVTLSGNMTSGDLGLQSVLTFTSTPSANNKVVCESDLPSGGGSNENLLLNPWFQVNSGGATSGDFNYVKSFDQWEFAGSNASAKTATWSYSNGILTLNDTNITSGVSYVHQDGVILEDNKTYTMSILYSDGTVNSKTFYNNGNAFGERVNGFAPAWLKSSQMFHIRGDYEETGTANIKAVKIELGSTSTIALDVKPSYNEDLMKLGYINGNSNRNLLDNAWFTVNQKGLTSGDFNNNKIDRWKTSYASDHRGNWTLSNGILTLNNTVLGNEYWVQVIENFSDLVGKQLTASMLYSNGTIISGTLTLLNATSQNFVNDDNCIIQFDSSNNFRIAVKSGKSISIKALKLELGSTSTLAFDTAPDYATELLKCQRYLQPINVYTVLCRSPRVATTWWGLWNLPTPFRATPTLSTTSKELDLFTSSSYAEELNPTINMTVSGNIINLVVQSTASGKEGSSATLMVQGWLDAQL